MVRSAALLLATVVCAIPSQASGAKRLALLVGVNDGGAEREVLRYATSDAAAVAGIFETLGGVARDDQTLLFNASRAELLMAMQDIATQVQSHRDAGERTELIVYYSGHSDEDGLLLGEQRLSYRELRTWLDTVPAEVRIAILDSCASGALTRLKGGKRKPGPLRLNETDVRGYAYLTSASATESAQESDRLQGSFFTHYLVSGLLGAADFSNDGTVSLNEAYQFAYAETLARTENTQSGPQHASYDIRLNGAGDVTLTDLRVRDSGFSLDEDIAGRVFINGEDRKVVAELRKFGGDRVELSVPSGDYEIFVANGSQRWSGAFKAKTQTRRPVALADLRELDFE
ncbi:MAG: caspase family protein, partial [Myxococcota bacterium]